MSAQRNVNIMNENHEDGDGDGDDDADDDGQTKVGQQSKERVSEEEMQGKTTQCKRKIQSSLISNEDVRGSASY